VKQICGQTDRFQLPKQAFFAASQRALRSKWGRFRAHQGLKLKKIFILSAMQIKVGKK